MIDLPPCDSVGGKTIEILFLEFLKTHK